MNRKSKTVVLNKLIAIIVAMLLAFPYSFGYSISNVVSAYADNPNNSTSVSSVSGELEGENLKDEDDIETEDEEVEEVDVEPISNKSASTNEYQVLTTASSDDLNIVRYWSDNSIDSDQCNYAAW